MTLTIGETRHIECHCNCQRRITGTGNVEVRQAVMLNMTWKSNIWNIHNDIGTAYNDPNV